MANGFYVITRMRHLYKFIQSLIVAMEPGKRHALRAHMPEPLLTG